MASPLSETPETLSRLRHAVWHGDWNDAADLAGLLAPPAEPSVQQDLRIRLGALHEILDAAKTGRAEMLASLSRLRAVAGFNPPDVQSPS